MAAIAMTEPSSQDGFSILEMIVAMTILALVLGIASQSIPTLVAHLHSDD